MKCLGIYKSKELSRIWKQGSVIDPGSRYWEQGYSIFSKYDEGIWMTDDAWYGVTHESVAKYVVRSSPS